MTGTELKQWREDRGMTRTQLAILLPLPLGTLKDQEQGATPVHPLMERALRDLERELAAR